MRTRTRTRRPRAAARRAAVLGLLLAACGCRSTVEVRLAVREGTRTTVETVDATRPEAAFGRPIPGAVVRFWCYDTAGSIYDGGTWHTGPDGVLRRTFWPVEADRLGRDFKEFFVCTKDGYEPVAGDYTYTDASRRDRTVLVILRRIAGPRARNEAPP